jgi:uncharacterized protein YecE (DUF72 family)
MASSRPARSRASQGALRLGTAGWTLPREHQPAFPPDGSHLARYAAVLDAAEINSTFRRSHRPATLARWGASVPAAFRFSVKMPRAITHEARLVDAAPLIDAFLHDIAPLRDRIGCLLVQLPPSLAPDVAVVTRFLDALRARHDGPVALEPRHPDWFSRVVDRLLASRRIARVAADPARVPGADVPGGYDGLVYHRLHGTPRIYYSAYDDEFLDRLALRLRATLDRGIPTWCIFDNTTLGAATGNALDLRARLGGSVMPCIR